MDALWYNYDLTEPREITKCIKQLERICRDSLEYDDWQRKCKYTDSTICPVCDDNYYDNNSKCESHHHPKTLYNIVENILDDHLEKNDLDDKTGLQIVQEIMDLHLFNKVQYINLCQHCHKKYHAGHPDVRMKLDVIFEKRVRESKEKEVEEEVEELIISSDNAAPEAPPIDYPIIQKNLETHSLKNHAQLLEESTKIIENETSGVEPIHSKKDLKKPEVLNIETSQDFISIDIDNL